MRDEHPMRRSPPLTKETSVYPKHGASSMTSDDPTRIVFYDILLIFSVTLRHLKRSYEVTRFCFSLAALP